ncbi:hypothetical protein N7448_000978 [Penicillium atrosanguineum]|uniref:Uncharacterized protein n=1 Tax=Penicillium atrosanguineum TaxID=1132637 RepID=A0A9W9LD27_9EURO|nr:uncharacterized protein N7443_004375 [Penicillium atrosanguineum]KAJ5149400.1 hypothetical protein N7448_000978 [Penicillium atrosanguineum]KAJ5304715.1 hypothetical protein N7443_004375 [Penicillium atrosanguineum]KAJ5324180.1 hypothetical protein N7476_002780 [Penicillium atrosanguineum]
MAPANNKHKDTSSRHRSHKGCWTCKRKRIQCDETQPGCRKCTERGLTCEGYGIRLRWGAGIASRGRFTGAEKPTKESIPPPSKRRWDLRTKGEQSEEGDQQGQPMLLLGHTRETRSLSLLNQPINERPTVNILNTPYGQDPSDYIGIKKHFELPVSASMVRDPVELFTGPQMSQYEKGMRRSAIIA